MEESEVEESEVKESGVFLGRKLLNIRNDCYINSIVNLVLSSERIRNDVIGKQCDCPFCQHLLDFLKNSNKSHNARLLKTLMGRLNPATFGGDNLNKQQDVEECLTILINNCTILKKLTTFETFKKRKCMNENCMFKSEGSHERNRTIFSCHMNTAENDINIIEDMVNSNTSIDFMICSKCKLMTKEEGSRHEAKEVFSTLPSVLLCQ